MMSENRSVFLHGLGQNKDVWKPVKDKLAIPPEFICPSLFLQSLDEVITYEHIYRDIQRLIADFDEPVNLCGLSLGGVLALQYCIEQPKKVRAAVLIAAQYRMPRGLLSFQNAVFRFMPESSFRETGLSKQEMIALTNSMKKLDFPGSLKNINCPVAIVCGEKDRVNRKASEELASLLPNAELHIIKGAAHEVNREAPDVLADILNNYF